jgi:hypothetical protein
MPEQAPDLDLRPGEPVRSTMSRWLQQCPGCGYCAPDITHAHPAAADAVRAAPFRALLADNGIPPLARRFLAYALVLEESGAMHASAEATLQAAWVADDLDRPDLARPWRLDAVALWRGGPPRDAEQTVRLLGQSVPEVVTQVVRLEQRLIEAGDTGRHTMASAMPPPAHRPHVSHQRIAARGEGFWAKVRRLFGGA